MLRSACLLLFLAHLPTVSAVGGMRDEHGCYKSAGYLWCETSQKCHRPWEEKCPEANKKLTELVGLGPQLAEQNDFGKTPPKKNPIMVAPKSFGLGPQISSKILDPKEKHTLDHYSMEKDAEQVLTI